MHFARIMGDANAQRMLGEEGWKPSAHEAKEAGLIQWATSQADLMTEAKKIAKGWVAEGATRTYRGGSTKQELKEVNARESVALADAFLAAPFMKAQFKFLSARRSMVRPRCSARCLRHGHFGPVCYRLTFV